MLAINIESFGDPSVLRPVQVSVPSAGEGELLIRVEAAGVARADILQRQGKYPPPHGASPIPGLDVAGVVASPATTAIYPFQPGDPVCAIVAGGGYAEYVAVPVQQVLPAPEGWTAVETASLPENLFTAFDALKLRAQLRPGETALIHGGSSGVGSLALMLCQTFGATAYATAGSDEKCQACLSFGAAVAINYRTEGFGERVQSLTQGRGVDLILDMVGGSYLTDNVKCLATGGRLLLLATPGGRTAPLDLGELLKRRLSIYGCSMRSRSAAEKGVVAEALRNQIWPLLPSKSPIRPVVDSVFPLAEAADAHRRMESGQHTGKIVLVMPRA